MAKLTKRSIDVVTSGYHFSHGAEPRGRGSWAFAFGSPEEEPVWCSGSVTYQTARAWAVAEACRRGTLCVYVCS